MKGVFETYGRYYDLIYRGKDYAAEAEYVMSHIRAANPTATSILELGCGTGAHAEHFARAGFTVTGIDVSAVMLEAAANRKSALPGDIGSRLSFLQGDVRDVRLDRQFDVVLSLFHVMSYQTSNADLLAALATATNHLAPNGTLIFDFWYGPAVLTQKPATRIARFEDEAIQVIRLAEPELRARENTVLVNYHIISRDKQSNAVAEARETHAMRYLFEPEIDALLSAKVERASAYGWMTMQQPSESTWNACIVARAGGC